MKVAVFGCGPAGLLAAHAVSLSGHEPVIYSRKVKSQMFGAMFLHRAIPEVTRIKPDMQVKVSKWGTKEGYAENVYGDPNAKVSWDRFEAGAMPAWNLSRAYSILWGMYNKRIHDAQLNSRMISRVVEDYDLAFTTIPAPAICLDPGHEFLSQKIHVLHGRTTEIISKAFGAHEMIYNGWTPDGKYGQVGPLWYRYSAIAGYESWEFAQHGSNLYDPQYLPSNRSFEPGTKPLTTTCDCHPNIHRLGRFGKWDKNAFTHQAFEEVGRALQ